MAISDPKVLVIAGIRERWSAKERQQQAATMNGVESWVYAFNGDYIGENSVTSDDIARYDIVIGNTNYIRQAKHAEKLLTLINNRPTHTKWITLIEGCASDYLIPSPYIKTIFDSSDMVNCINRHSLPFLQSLTSTKVEYIGIPYPVDEIVKLRIPIEKRNKSIFCCGLLLKRWNDYHVAKQLGLSYYGYERGFSRKLKYIAKNWSEHRSIFNQNKAFDTVRHIYNDPNLQIRKIASQNDYFSDNANAYMWLNLDDRYTWGRYVLDAAALGIPIISTDSTGHAAELFPLTTLNNEYNIEKAVELGKKLIEDFDFYKAVADYPFGKMEHLRPVMMRTKLLQSIGL